MPRAKRRLCRSVAGAELCPERTPLLEEGRGQQGWSLSGGRLRRAVSSSDEVASVANDPTGRAKGSPSVSSGEGDNGTLAR